MSYDLNAAKTKAATKTQDDLDHAFGELLNNFEAQLVELADKPSMTQRQKTEVATELNNRMVVFMAAILNGQAASLLQPSAPSGGSALGATPSPAPAADPKLQQELTDLRAKVKTQADALNDIAATCSATITGGDYSKLATAVKDYGKDEAKKAEAKKADDFKDVLPKADGEKAADDILYWVNQGKKGFGGTVKFSEDDFDNLKARVEQLKNDTK